MSRIKKYFWFFSIFPNLFGISMEKQKSIETPWHVPIGVGVLLIKKDCVFLQQRSYKDWGFGVIAGKLNKGETLRRAAIRHVAKESGVTIDEADLDFLCFVHYKTEDEKEAPLVFFFSTSRWVGEPFNKEPERHNKIGWFHLDQLPAHLAPGEDLVFHAYKRFGANANAYLERGWEDFLSQQH